MYLKRLRLHGYKTFANPTDFEFDSGITAIVGPNGSGKSNIADAVRWVLGEQSFTTLRAKRTEDMIFAGGKQRARLGMAEATMTFDNSEQWLDTEFSEVSVSRRAYRSGENEYLLNQNHVRLRDILEILGKAGLGRSTYVVIGQGLVDAALSLRPIERRSLIEEAAGVANYLAKRQSALSRLDETRQNMLRVHDIIHEITPRLRRLERQAKRAEEHALLARDLTSLLRTWYGYQWQSKVRRMAEVDRKLARQEGLLADQRARSRELDESLRQVRERRLELGRKLNAWRQKQAEVLSQIEEQRRNLAVNEERISQYRRQASQIQDEIASTAPRSEVIARAITDSESELERLAASEEHASANLESMKRQLDVLKQRRGDALTKLNEAQEESYSIAAEIAAARSELLQTENRTDQMRADLAEHQRLLQEQSDQRDTLVEQITRLAAAQAGREERAGALQTQIDARRAELTECMQTQTELRSSADRAHARTEQLAARWELLDRMRRDSTGYNPAVRGLLAQREKLPGIIGPITNLMKVPEELEKAIDAALGSLVQAIAVENWKAVVSAASLLQELDAGQATLISVADLPPRKPISPELPSQALGVASELIGFAEEHQALFHWLLGDVVVARDLPGARDLRRHLKDAGARVVTLAGETLGRDAIVTVGPRKVEASLIRQEREWQALPAQISVSREEEERMLSALEKEEVRRESLESGIVELGKQHDELRLKIREDEADRSRHQQEHAALSGEIDWHENAVTQLGNDLTAGAHRRKALQTQIEAAQAKQSAQTQLIANLRETLDGLSDSELQKNIASLEASLAVAQRSRQSQLDLIESHRTSLLQLKELVEQRQLNASQLEQDCSILASESAELRSDIDLLSRNLESIRQEAEPAEAEIEAIEQARERGAMEEQEARERLRQLESQLGQTTLDKARLQDALDGLTREIEEELGPVKIPGDAASQLQLGIGPDAVPLPAASTLPEGLEAEIKELRARLKRISPINPNAPEEHAEASERHDFLVAQSQDLEEATTSLHEVIAELDDIIETDFRATFTAVAREFKRYFSLLFNGGTARLVLTDPEDINNSGIEIMARPPGKRSQSLALLSGGERSLTATALLFALLKVNPLPFCILDEVDAMLDEANVGRFRDVLRELTADTQFIVISHNRVTIEAAHAIYGVSLEEDGTSKTISLQIPRKEESKAPQSSREASVT